jgi:MerR family transcriptional regulator/heat shock protein HspR
MPTFEEEPVFVISVAARRVGVHQQTLRTYERQGLVAPARSRGGVRLYSARDLARLLAIRHLTDELGVNLAGVDLVLRLTGRIQELDALVRDLRQEVQRERDRHLPATRPAAAPSPR